MTIRRISFQQHYFGTPQGQIEDIWRGFIKIVARPKYNFGRLDDSNWCNEPDIQDEIDKVKRWADEKQNETGSYPDAKIREFVDFSLQDMIWSPS
jgi:hypothetical protein